MNINEISPKHFLLSFKEILKKVLGLTDLQRDITMETSLVYGVGKDSLDLSSIDFVDLIIVIENYYDVVFEFDATIKTIQDLYDYVVKAKNERAEDENNE